MRYLASRQIRNQGLRDAGVKPTESYHPRVGPGDIVQIHVVMPPMNVQFVATVRVVVDHGHYEEVWWDAGDMRLPRGGRIYLEGPPHEGIVEFRVLRKVYFQGQPHRERI